LRLWRQPVEPFLTGGLGLLPLAPLCDVPAAGLPAVIDRMARRLSREAAPGEADQLWTASYVLMGLSLSKQIANGLMRRVLTMKESVTYQAIVEEGEVKALQETLLELGTERFGPADETVRAAIQSNQSVDHLKAMRRHLLTAATWAALLATPRPRRGRRSST
jgi:hypothetical protein